MRKFVSFVSSIVLASGSLCAGTAMQAGAETNTDVKETIVALRSDGKSTITALPGETIPVSLYIPQSSGFQTFQLRLAIGKDGDLNDTLGKGFIFDREGVMYPNFEGAFGNYDISMSSVVTQLPSDEEAEFTEFSYPNCLHSGYTVNDSSAAGYIGDSAFAIINCKTWSIYYSDTYAIANARNVDSMDAWKAAGGEIGKDFDYSSYTPVTTWTKDEPWAYQTPFVTFNLTLPEKLENGTYVLDIYRDTYINTHPSSLFNDKNEWKDKDHRGYGRTNFIGEFLEEKEYRSEKLVINVGGIGDAGEAVPQQTQKAPAAVRPLSGTEKFGDVDCSGDLGVNDIVLLNRYLAKTATLTKEAMINADCERDNKIDAKDCDKLKRAVAKMIDMTELGKYAG